MVLTLASGALPPAVAAVMAAGGVVLLRVLSVQQAYRAISWSTVILVGGMIPLTTAMTQTGAADQIADRITEAVGDSSPYVLLVTLVILVMVLGQLISNTATALIVIPVAIASAYELDVSVQPVLMAVNVAATASFLTPVATPANLMVMEPGGYRFGDYWKLGLAQMVLYFVIAVFLVPEIWKF
jgi:di/tricarboxylate transporter